jgi:hypothetical protein
MSTLPACSRGEPRHLHRVAVAVRDHLEDLDLEQVTGPGAADMDRAGQWVYDVQVRRGDRCERRIVAS